MKKITMLFFMTLATMFMGTSSYAQYCTPEGTNTARYVDSFSTTAGSQNITNIASGFSTGGYGDFTSLIAEQGLGGSVNFSTGIEGGTAGFRIWVDWNQDGVFDTTSEVAYQSSSYLSSHQGSFVIPADALLGSTRMRIVSHWLSTTGSIDPCATGFTYGEFEDYTLIVSSDVSFDCPELEANIGSACDDGNANTMNDILNADCECVGIPVAVNNEACDATALACGDIVNQSLIGASSSMTDTCYGSGTADVWFTFTTDGSQIYTVAETSSFDAVVQLFSGDSCGDLVSVGICSDFQESYEVTEAGTYYFRVRPYGAASNEGTISVSLTCEDFDCTELNANIGDACDDGDPNTVGDVVTEDCECSGIVPGPGADCSEAIAVVCNADPVTHTSIGSSATNTTTCSMGNSGLWFSFMGTGGDITINSTAAFDHEMSVNKGSCGALVNIACRDGSTLAETYTIVASVVGEMYYVYIAQYASGNTTTGNITMSIVCATPPACTAPTLALAVQDVEGNPITDCLDSGSQYYVLATLSGGDGNTSYNVSTNSGAAVEVNADGSVVLGPISVGTNASVTAVGVQDEDCGVSEVATSPAFCPPSNDACDDAIPLVCGVTVTGNTAMATASGLSSTCGSYTSSDAKDLFYSFEADGTSNYLVSLSQPTGSTAFDGVLFVYSGTCGALTSLGCSDSGNPEEMELVAPAAGTYIVRIFDYSGTAAFTLSVECVPLSVNDYNTFAKTRLYPNPLNDTTFNVYAPNLNGELVNVNIVDMAGRQIFNTNLECSDNKVTVSLNDNLTAGVYFVTLNHSGETHTYRLVKE